MQTTAKNYSVELEIFQGPLDLLLYLIRKDEIDIYDIPIARITEQYLKYVEVLKLLNLENAGEYILMAATLIRIKAHMLLPRDAQDDEEMDLREELTLALLEYRKYKEGSDILREKRTLESRLTPVSGRSNGFKSGQPVLTDNTSLFELLTAFHDVISSFKEEELYLVDHQDLTVEDRIAVIMARLAQREFATFEELFSDIRVKIVAIITFIAILEMVKSRRIIVHQAMPFSELRVYRAEMFDQPIVTEQSEEIEEVQDTETEVTELTVMEEKVAADL
jgi:segregation and condensation protein A